MEHKAFDKAKGHRQEFFYHHTQETTTLCVLLDDSQCYVAQDTYTTAFIEKYMEDVLGLTGPIELMTKFFRDMLFSITEIRKTTTTSHLELTLDNAKLGCSGTLEIPVKEGPLDACVYRMMEAAYERKEEEPQQQPQQQPPDSPKPTPKRSFQGGTQWFPKRRKLITNHKQVIDSSSSDSDTPVVSVTQWIKTFFAPDPFVSEERNEAALLGSQLHADIERYFQGKGDEVKNESLEYRYFLEFTKDRSTWIVEEVEHRLEDPTLKLTGCIDVLMRDDKGQRWLLDWKRVVSINKDGKKKAREAALKHLPDCNYTKYALQLYMYKMLVERVLKKKVDKVALVQLHPSQEGYVVIPVPNVEKEVVSVVAKRSFVNH